MNNIIKDGGAAFPRPYSQNIIEFTSHEAQEGMSLRDYFAVKAMQGWLASYGSDQRHPVDVKTENILAIQSYKIADAMLEAREK